jgi:hypothetical protein
MKRGNIWLIVGGVVLLAALIAFALSQFFGASRHVPFSVESPDRLGTKALFSLYQKRGVKATTWDGNEDSLPDTGGNTLHIIFPMNKPPSATEREKLLAWVGKGNRIVLWAPLESNWPEAFGFRSNPCPGPIMRPVHTKSMDPWLKQMALVKWTSQQCVSPGRQDRPLLTDQNNDPLVVSRQQGSGQIIYIPDPFLITNQNLDQADDFALPLSFAEEKSGTVLFDESVHPWPPQPVNGPQPSAQSAGGDKEPGMPTLFELLAHDGWFVFLQLVLLIILWLYARGKRFGAPRLEKVVKKRDALEYAEAMARWYRHARIRKETLLQMYGQLRQELAHRLQLPSGASDELLLERLEQAFGTPFRRAFEEFSNKLLKAVYSKRTLSEETYVEWSRTILLWRKEIQKWRAMMSTSTGSRT